MGPAKSSQEWSAETETGGAETGASRRRPLNYGMKIIVARGSMSLVKRDVSISSFRKKFDAFQVPASGHLT